VVCTGDERTAIQNGVGRSQIVEAVHNGRIVSGVRHPVFVRELDRIEDRTGIPDHDADLHASIRGRLEYLRERFSVLGKWKVEEHRPAENVDKVFRGVGGRACRVGHGGEGLRAVDEVHDLVARAHRARLRPVGEPPFGVVLLTICRKPEGRELIRRRLRRALGERGRGRVGERVENR
jgi:hypothetical protein